MVRAAVSGAINYSDADPDSKQWRIKHNLIITEISRRERQKVLEQYHAHLCAYLSHSKLTEESFTQLKKSASAVYKDIKNTAYPWLAEEKENESAGTNSKIDSETQNLINRYREYQKTIQQGKNVSTD